jgi:hypothetical protein
MILDTVEVMRNVGIEEFKTADASAVRHGVGWLQRNTNE